jgi:hypothetical protein
MATGLDGSKTTTAGKILSRKRIKRVSKRISVL